MTDEQLKRAVAKCADWQWHHAYPESYATDAYGIVRLRGIQQLSLDDVVAACEAAGVHWHLGRSLSERNLFKASTIPQDVSRRTIECVAPNDPAKALALALIEACGVEVEDE